MSRRAGIFSNGAFRDLQPQAARVQTCLIQHGIDFLDQIAVGQELARNVYTDEDSRKKRPMEIVRTIIAMAQILGMQVVAEGVEVTEQLSILRELGCEFGQGFLFSPALDPNEATRFFGAGVVLS